MSRPVLVARLAGVLGLTALCLSEGRAQSLANRWLVVRPGLTLSAPVAGVLRVESKGDGWARLIPAVLNVVVHLEFRALTENSEAAVLVRSLEATKPGQRPNVGYRVALLDGPRARAALGEVTAYWGNS